MRSFFLKEGTVLTVLTFLGDKNIAMLLGAAKILMEPAVLRTLCGKVKFIFQSGEETARGSKYYIDHGILDDVDAVFGLHTWGTLEAPYLCVDGGRRMASTDNFTIKIKGLKAHGAAPHLGHDAIVAASAVVMALQSFVSRENDPLNPLVLTVGKFHGGNSRRHDCGNAAQRHEVAEHGRHVDDLALVLRDHLARGELTQEEHGVEIDVDHIVPRLLFKVHGRHAPLDASAVDENVQM